MAGVAGELLDLVDEVVAGERGPGVEDAVPRRRRLDARRRRIGRGHGREVGGACRVELGDGAGRGLVVGQGEARPGTRANAASSSSRRACRRRVSRSVAPAHAVRGVLDQPADRQARCGTAAAGPVRRSGRSPPPGSRRAAGRRSRRSSVISSSHEGAYMCRSSRAETGHLVACFSSVRGRVAPSSRPHSVAAHDLTVALLAQQVELHRPRCAIHRGSLALIDIGAEHRVPVATLHDRRPVLGAEVSGDGRAIAVDREALRADQVLRRLEPREEAAHERHVGVDRQPARRRLGLVVARVDDDLVREHRAPEVPVPRVEAERIAVDQIAEVGLVRETLHRPVVDRDNLRSCRSACSS